MLITLTRFNGGNPATPLYVAAEQILSVEPTGPDGSTVMLVGGTKHQVHEAPDVIADLCDAIHDPADRKKAAETRRVARDKRQEAERQRLASIEEAKAKQLHEVAERERLTAEASAKRARDAQEAAARAGRGEKPVTPATPLSPVDLPINERTGTKGDPMRPNIENDPGAPADLKPVGPAQRESLAGREQKEQAEPKDEKKTPPAHGRR